jgi:hypothetical protein
MGHDRRIFRARCAIFPHNRIASTNRERSRTCLFRSNAQSVTKLSFRLTEVPLEPSLRPPKEWTPWASIEAVYRKAN